MKKKFLSFQNLKHIFLYSELNQNISYICEKKNIF